MKCQICNGDLKFKNNVYVCENCGLHQTISTFFEKTDVFLCFIENDMQGRRSRDSVIAQDLYSKLENAKIRTFNQRISAADLTDSDLETANTIAFDSAKIIVVIATTAENFQILIEKYGENFVEKRVIPVYANMNANELPEKLKHLQAVNYNAVGASVDFVKNILRMLGKEQEVDITATAKKHMNKKRRTVIVSLCLIFALALSTSAYIVFGTPYVLQSKKYEYAKSLASEGKLIKAVELFSKLGGYQNSVNEIKDIYSKYNGYFINEEKNLSLYLNLSTHSTATVEIMCINSDNSYDKASATAMITDNRIQFEFDSNLNQHGTGTIELDDNGVFLQITLSDDSKNTDCFFEFKDKSDAPIRPLITKDTLIEWLKTPITLEDIKKQGYELIRTDARTLQIKDTDIFIHEENLDMSNPSSSEVVFRISAPAHIIMPEMIGSQFTACEENNYLYIAGYHMGRISGAIGLEDMPDETYSGVLEENTEMILAYKKHAVFKNSWYPYKELLFYLLVELELEEVNVIGEDNSAYYAEKTDCESIWSPIQQKNIIVGNAIDVSLYRIDKSNFQKDKVYEKQVENATIDNINKCVDGVLAEYESKNGLEIQNIR